MQMKKSESPGEINETDIQSTYVEQGGGTLSSFSSIDIRCY